MKVYVSNPEEYQENITNLLQWASDHIENPDLRDRIFFYWRLLTINQNVAKSVLFSEKQSIDFY